MGVSRPRPVGRAGATAWRADRRQADESRRRLSGFGRTAAIEARTAAAGVSTRRVATLVAIPGQADPHQAEVLPVNGDLAAYWIIAARETGTPQALALAGAVGRALWEQERDIADPARWRRSPANAGSMPRRSVRGRMSPTSPRVTQRNTQEAIARGVFGAPTYVYQDELFWGQDRLDFLGRKLAK